MKKHLCVAIFMGMSLRLLSLYFVWGPQALDDYLDNIYPAWRHTLGQFPDLHSYRSPFYMWILSFWLRLGSVLGVEHAIAQIRWVYFLQALASMLAIYGVYWLTRRVKNPLVPILSMYLVAMHGLMPFASTRSFMESFVMGPIAFAFALLVAGSGGQNCALDDKIETPSAWKVFFGFTILGLASLLRFQVGLLYFAWLGLFLYEKNWRAFWIGFAFGWVLVALEAGFDLAYGRKAFETLWAYVVFNSDQEKSVRMPWYNTWLTWLGFLFFPFALCMGRAWLTAFRRHWRIFVPILFYVVIHSINPHKEERYMYPVVPLSFIFLAEAWCETRQSKWVRWIFQPAFLVLNSLALAVGCFINTQVGFIGPFGEIEASANHVLYLDYDNFPMRNWAAEFFMRGNSKLIHAQGPVLASDVERIVGSEPSFTSVALLASDSDADSTMIETQQVLSQIWNCSDLKKASSISDQVLYHLNPTFNQRRRPTLYFLCHKKT